jgi:small subunit ribosomal protein S9
MAVKKITPAAPKKVTRDYIYAHGRQKQAVARVRLHPTVREGDVWGEHEIKKEQILVNEMPIEHYFPGPLAKAHYNEPLQITNTLNRYAVTVKVVGGGKNGQLDAVVKGIANALSEADPIKYREILKKKGFLTRDARVKERRKVGRGGKARAQKQSPKR